MIVTQKHAQVTLFVLLGMVLLSVIGLLFFFRAEILESLTRTAPSTVARSAQAEKVLLYVESCLEAVTEEAVELAGVQGGFVQLPEDEFSPAYNVLSNHLDVFGNGAMRVPYWYYKTPNNLDRINIPSKVEIGTQVAAYVDARLPECLENFKPFKEQGYALSFETPVSTGIIANNEVIVETAMPVDVLVKEQDFSFTTFKVNVEAPLGRLYDMASELFAYENKMFFVENSTLDFMAIYDEIPFSGLDFECTPRAWLKSQVALDMKKILAANTPLLKVKGTNFLLAEKNNRMFVFDALEKPSKDVTVQIRYDKSWPLIMDVVGENSEVLRGKPFTTESKVSQFLLPLFCLNDYHFVYDLEYPVLISLLEDDFVFQFAFVSIIDNNQARENTAVLPLLAEDDTRICENKPTKAHITVLGAAPGGALTPLDDVELSLQCITTVCDLGTTRQIDAGYALQAFVPACLNGQVTAKKVGYHQITETVDTTQETAYSLIMEPYNELPVSILVLDGQELRTPYPTEEILFVFENEEQEHYTSFHYPSQSSIQLVAGNYKVSSTVLVQTKGGFTFEDETVEVCIDAPKEGVLGFFGAKEKKCTQQTIEGTTLDAVIAGGGSFSWLANKQEMAAANELVLYTVRGATPTTFDELSQYAHRPEQFSATVKKPAYK